jgi:hypothetical protein
MGVNPETVIVAMRRANRAEGLAAVNGAIHAGVENVDRVRRARISKHVRVIESPLAILAVAVHERPVVAAIVGAEEATLVRFNQRPDTVAVGVSHSHANAANRRLGQSVLFQTLPGVATVSAAIETAARATAVHGPG